MRTKYIVLFSLRNENPYGQWKRFSSKKAADKFFDDLLTTFGPDLLEYRALAPRPPTNLKSSGKV